MKKQLPFSSPTDLEGPILINNRSYVPEPPMDKEKTVIWASHVLIPFSLKGNIHAFLGPLPRSPMKLAKLEKIFP